MKPKTQRFADRLLKDPKISATQAYLDTHETTNKATARSNASILLSKPSVQIYLKSHVTQATHKVVELIHSEKDDIALRAAQDILDRTHGKPIARTNNLNINISIEDALNSLE